MSRVKQIAALGALAGVALIMAGCSKSQLSRLAPPGILKYEDIASEKPANPAIEAEVAARLDDKKAKYPVLAQTPAAGRVPERAPSAEVKAQSDALKTARDAIDADLARHRDAEDAAQEERDRLNEVRASLAEQIDQDEVIARRERAAPMPSLKQTRQDD